MDEHLIEDGLWQRVLEGLRSEPHMHLHDLHALRRFVSACFAVLRRNCSWTELACFFSSAEAVKKRFRCWAKKGIQEWLMEHSQPLAGPGILAHRCRCGPSTPSGQEPIIGTEGLYRSINVFIERLWRSLKHECVYLHAFETGSKLRAGLAY